MRHYSYGTTKKKISVGTKKIVGIGSVVVGIIMLVYFFFPVFSYHIYLSSAFAGGTIEAPLPNRLVLQDNLALGGLIAQGISNVTSDYTDARNWFPNVNSANAAGKEVKKVDEYTLSIPSQKIKNAKVSGIDYDLSKHLVQYFTTSKNPTDNGTSVIFGHSTLPQWFDPTDYKAIFAQMHKMKVGEVILLHVNGKDYTYKVFAINITSPDDANIFSQSFDNSYITIVTCTPPGTVWKRLVLRASLMPS